MSTHETSQSRASTPDAAPPVSEDGKPGGATPNTPGAESAPGISALRRFHLTGKGRPAPLPSDLLPASLQAHRDPLRIRDGYPLFVPALDDATSRTDPAPLSELLRDASRDAMPEGEVRSVVDNLDRLELEIRGLLADRTAPAHAGETLTAAVTAMLEKLQLDEAVAAEAREGFDRLLAAVPDGSLVPCASETPLHLFVAARAAADREHERDARGEIVSLAAQLGQRLEADHAKRDSGRSSEALGRSLGTATHQFFDPSSVAKLVGRVRGAVPMSDARRARMESSLAIIRGFVEENRHLASIVTTEELAGKLDLAPFDVIRTEDPLGVAHERAVAAADAVVTLCRAARHARLEIDGRYDPERHDEWLDALDADSLDEDERALLEPVLVIVRERDVTSSGLQRLSAALASSWPIAILVLAPPLRPLDAPRHVELGYFGVAHRRAFVQQGSVAHPLHLHRGFVRALRVPRPSLHVLDVGETAGGDVSALGRWLRAAALTEGRAHPLFRFDPGAGADWATRFDVEENPEPDAAWPTAELPAGTTEDDQSPPAATAFTFADVALLEPALDGELTPAPDEVDDAFVPFADYLELAGSERAGHVPYVWACDAAGAMRRVVVSARLCREAAERRDFWHTLQELAGIRNAHVDRARSELRRELDAETEERLRRADEEHTEALDRARAEAAGEALDGLARFLVGMDAGAVLGGDATAAATGVRPAATAVDVPVAPETEPTQEEPEPEAAAPEAEPEAPAEDEDPWIETALCTSCNDCTNINSKLFVYDGNKQAHIGDVDAGTYAELVAAAEKCPARCIHPGTPRNPDEPNLDELRRRAAPFNT